MMTRVPAVLAALILIAFAAIAHAQPGTEVRTTESVEAADGADLATFASGVEAAARSAGAEAPSRDEIEAAFSEADANGDGTLDAREQSGASTPRDCSGRGVCHMGRCFCVSGRLIEDNDTSTATHENPLFEAADGPQQNTLGQ